MTKIINSLNGGGLPSMPKIQEIIKIFGLSAKQQLSQNFLIDKNITDKICKRSGGFKDCTVIEVGAGPGGLTRSLLTSGAKKVIAVEMDPRFYPALKMLEEASEGRMKLVMANMMDVDEAKILRDAGAEVTAWNEDKAKVKIIGNLPFNVGTHLMLKWIRQIAPREGLYEFGRVPMYLMFQKELSDRIVSQVDSEDYSRLSVMVQQATIPKVVYEIPGSAFVPPPKVDASVVAIEPRIIPLGEPIKDHHCFEFVCRELFSQKRKMLSNTIKTLGENAISLLGDDIPSNIRPQNLKIEEFVKISNRYVDFPNKRKIDPLEFLNDGKSIRKEQKLQAKVEKINEKIEKTKKRQQYRLDKSKERKEQQVIGTSSGNEETIDIEDHQQQQQQPNKPFDIEDEIDNEMFQDDINMLDSYNYQLKAAMIKKERNHLQKQKKIENREIIDEYGNVALPNHSQSQLQFKNYDNIDDIDIDTEEKEEDEEIDYEKFLNDHLNKK